VVDEDTVMVATVCPPLPPSLPLRLPPAAPSRVKVADVTPTGGVQVCAWSTRLHVTVIVPGGLSTPFPQGVGNTYVRTILPLPLLAASAPVVKVVPA
jgi:hypothetical protein